MDDVAVHVELAPVAAAEHPARRDRAPLPHAATLVRAKVIACRPFASRPMHTGSPGSL
jgi:hypothetical protein